MKCYMRGVASVLMAMPLIPNHPVLFMVAVVLLTTIILTFWTGLVRVEKSVYINTRLY